MRGERPILGLILATIFGLLAAHADQPIVENYVGRQIPTAMVARNLERGSGFLRPTLDTAPFPNRFLVEPPIYAQLVAWGVEAVGSVHHRLGLSPPAALREAAGRLISAALTTLGAAALYALVRRREGPAVALPAVAAFGILPVTLRYGRAFQPDATMLGLVLLGMAGWDAYQATGRARFAWAGGLLLAAGLAVKVTSAWALIPFALVLTRWPVGRRLLAAGAMLVPALAWYGHAWGELRAAGPGAGRSLASADNAAIWLGTLSPLGWLRYATWDAVGRNLVARAFGPVGFLAAAAGLILVRPRLRADRLWLGWGLGCGLAIVALGAKWHHGYYWLAVAPPVALGVARSIAATAGRTRAGSAALAAAFAASCGAWSASTWRTPPEWESIRAAGARIAAAVPPDALLIAPEAVLYYADRAGLRLEFSPEAVRRASGEWGEPIPADRAVSWPLALVDFYGGRDAGDPRTRSGPPPRAPRPTTRAGFVADVGADRDDPRRRRWRAAVRSRYGATLRADGPTLILAELPPPWPHPADPRPGPPNPQP